VLSFSLESWIDVSDDLLVKRHLAGAPNPGFVNQAFIPLMTTFGTGQP
jgi:hypothetical protein